MSDKIHQLLDLGPVDKQEPITDLVQYHENDAQPLLVANNNQIAEDFEYARNNLYEIIEASKEALIDMFAVAKQAQHPKVYEAMNNTLKTTAEMTKDLLELHKAKKELMGPQAQQPQTVNNNLFLTTEELNQMLDDAKARKLDT